MCLQRGIRRFAGINLFTRAIWAYDDDLRRVEALNDVGRMGDDYFLVSAPRQEFRNGALTLRMKMDFRFIDSNNIGRIFGEIK